jgi:putative flippase GtrA
MTRPVWSAHTFAVLAYGDSPFLPGCLKALAAQTVQSRIIVLTSTPSEFITDAARSAGVDLRINPKREGIGADWNFALNSAGSRYVTLAHQDDVYFPDFLAKTKALFDANPDGAIAFTGFREIGDGGEPKTSLVSAVKHVLSAVFLNGRARVQGLSRRLFLSFGDPLTCSTVTYDLKNLPGFSFSTDLASNLDWEAWWRLHLEGKLFLHAPQKLLGRRHNELMETSRVIASGQRQAEDAMMFSAIWPKPIAKLLHVFYAASYGQDGGKIVRFALVGAALTLLSYLIFVGLLGFGAHYLIASAASWAGGILASYFLNKGFTFALGNDFVWREFGTLVSGYVLQLVLASLGYIVLIGELGLSPTPAFLVNLVIVAAFSFLFMNFVVFRKAG